LEELICAQCKSENDPVILDNGVSVPDVDGKIVVLHHRCVEDWILKQSSDTHCSSQIAFVRPPVLTQAKSGPPFEIHKR
jgi:hypothetical protein